MYVFERVLMAARAATPGFSRLWRGLDSMRFNWFRRGEAEYASLFTHHHESRLPPGLCPPGCVGFHADVRWCWTSSRNWSMSKIDFNPSNVSDWRRGSTAPVRKPIPLILPREERANKPRFGASPPQARGNVQPDNLHGNPSRTRCTDTKSGSPRLHSGSGIVDLHRAHAVPTLRPCASQNPAALGIQRGHAPGTISLTAYLR